MGKEREPPDELPRDVTPGGSEIIRHEPAMDDSGEVVYLTQEQMDRIEAHVEKYFGPVENVLHEIMSMGVHLDLLPVRFTHEGKPYLLLCTMGMSAVPMNMPDFGPENVGPDGQPVLSARVELFMVLPGDWPEPGTDEDHHWPVGLLKDLGRLPTMFETFLAPYHTVPNGDPPEPFSKACVFNGAMVLPADVLDDEREKFGRMMDEQGPVDFLLVAPLYGEEMDLKLRKGAESLLKRLDKAEMSPFELAKPGRPNVCAKGRPWWRLW